MVAQFMVEGAIENMLLCEPRLARLGCATVFSPQTKIGSTGLCKSSDDFQI
jgi:hypothetical protein